MAAMIAGIMNTSLMIVPLLAITATVTTVVIRLFSPFPALDLKAALSPNTVSEKPSAYRGAGRRFLIGTVGYGFAFGFAALIAALFQTTEFQPQIGLSDLGYLIVPAFIAVIGATIGARIGINQMAGMMDQMQDMFAQMQAQGQQTDDDAFTMEGEIIDPDEPKS